MFGILLIDKPEGWTSHDVCQKLKRVLSEKRIGHTGTLDPMATGLMVVCVGEATKFVKYVSDEDKIYEAEITFGISTDTQDITGEIVSTGDPSTLNETDLDQAIRLFVGPIFQTPPAYSAVKIDGKKLYEYAHAGKTGPDAAPREVFVRRFERVTPLTEIREGKRMVSVVAHVSKGTYVRTLAHDLGMKLGIPATLSKLRRVGVGFHSIQDAVTWESIDPTHPPFLNWDLAVRLPKITVNEDVSRRIANGAMLPTTLFPTREDTMVYDRHQNLLAVYQYDSTHNLMKVSVMCHANNTP
jgi:tRNA pseudouridine55 synthase